MAAKLTYAIAYVADMQKALAFYRDTLGLTVKFASPSWSEFVTGDVTLALHPATPEKPAGRILLGFNLPGLKALHAAGEGPLEFVGPLREEHGVTLGAARDSEGGEISLSA
jgi:catechol 2,3-dioxygenase-like lactoylglutathione lyase family enzyme